MYSVFPEEIGLCRQRDHPCSPSPLCCNSGSCLSSQMCRWDWPGRAQTAQLLRGSSPAPQAPRRGGTELRLKPRGGSPPWGGSSRQSDEGAWLYFSKLEVGSPGANLGGPVCERSADPDKGGSTVSVGGDLGWQVGEPLHAACARACLSVLPPGGPAADCIPGLGVGRLGCSERPGWKQWQWDIPSLFKFPFQGHNCRERPKNCRTRLSHEPRAS